MAGRPPPAEQRAALQALEQASPLAAGAPAFLIDARWFEDWKDFVSYDGHDPYVTTLDRIDNATFYRNGEITGTEGPSFCVVSEPVWNQLLAWYGGGPPVSVETRLDPRTSDVRAIVHKVKFHFVDDAHDVAASADGLTTIGDLKKVGLELFGLPADTESRLIDYWQDRVFAYLADEKYFDECNIQEGQKLFLDTKDASGKWQREKPEPAPYTPASTTSLWGSGSSRSYGTWAGPGRCGLSNLGNTCFFNSAVQCLLHTMPFVDHFLNKPWQDEINLENRLGTRGKLVRSFAGVVEQAWRGSSGVIDPFDLKMQMGRFATQFQGWAQQDSHELMTFMLDGIHEDLNRCREKPIVDSVVGDGLNDEETAMRAWENHLARNNSIVVDLFHGQLRSKLECPSCAKTTIVFDPYVAVQLPIQRAAPGGSKPIGVKFVPLDFASPPLALTITLPANPSNEDVSQAISALIGRNVKAVLGMKTYQSTVTWSLYRLHTDDEYATRWDEPWAFEIDDTDNLWVPVVLKMTKRDTYSYDYDDPILGPFLVPVDSDHNVARAAESRLSWLWPESIPESRPPLSDDASALKTRFKLPSASAIDSGSKIKASTWSTIAKSFYNSIVSDAFVTLTLTASAVPGFDFDALVTRAAAFSAVLLPTVTARGTLSLDECFAQFSETEVLDQENQWFCPHCRQFVCAAKTMNVWSVPRILIIHLKRFITEGYHSRKIETNVEYPDTLDITRFVVGPHRGSTQYRLYAVSEHSGGLGGGHYTAHALVQDPGGTRQWFDFNDSNAWQARAEDAHGARAYLLFYQRIDADDVGVFTLPPARAWDRADDSADDSTDDDPAPGLLGNARGATACRNSSSDDSSDEEDLNDRGGLIGQDRADDDTPLDNTDTPASDSPDDIGASPPLDM
jgi:ubiquitin carboxyl-terminal hydrolase 4/11/15